MRNWFEISIRDSFFLFQDILKNCLVSYPSGAELKPMHLKGPSFNIIGIIWSCLSSDDFNYKCFKFGCLIGHIIPYLLKVQSRT